MDVLPKILIVDDKRENLIALEAILKHLPIEIIKASSGIEALTATLEHDFILALLDVQMPVMDGYELAGILREKKKTASLPFIFISAVYTLNLNVFKGYEQGAFSFITKPLQADLLINKVVFFIEKHQQEIDLFELNKNLASKNEELETLNQELKALNQELEAFTYSVSHDLRAPLRVLNSYSQILKEDYSSDISEEAKKMLDSINRNAVKMGKLIDSLLMLSYLGRKDLQKTPVDMNALVQEVLIELNSANERSVFKIADLPEASGDKVLLKQVLTNLISNAIKYSGKKESPLIEIGFETVANKIVYFVKDNGVGFDMSYYDKLFGVFQRLHSSKEFEGNGAGLAIVQRILKKHKGDIWAEAKIDEGATFYFTL